MGGGKGENRKIVITVGPLLRILVSLYVEPIDTSRNIVVWVSFNWRRGNDAVDNAIKMATNWGERGSVHGVDGDGGGECSMSMYYPHSKILGLRGWVQGSVDNLLLLS